MAYSSSSNLSSIGIGTLPLHKFSKIKIIIIIIIFIKIDNHDKLHITTKWPIRIVMNTSFNTL